MNKLQNLYGEKEPTKQSSPSCGLGCCDLPGEVELPGGKAALSSQQHPWNLAQLQLPAAPYKHWTLPHSFFPHLLSILRLCSLFPGCLLCLDPKLHTEGTSALKLYNQQRVLFIINGHCHSCD